ncbi:MAG: thioredoxin family protein [Hyphomicrobium sp.]
MQGQGLIKFAVLIVGAVLLAAAPASAFQTKPFDAASFKAAQSAGEPLLVDVFAPWCPTCKAQQQVLDKLKDKPEFAKLTVFKVDFDNQPDVVRDFGARSQSTLIAYKGTTETGRSAGDTNPASIETLLGSTLK